jgi:hypothetical protein
MKEPKQRNTSETLKPKHRFPGSTKDSSIINSAEKKMPPLTSSHPKKGVSTSRIFKVSAKKKMSEQISNTRFASAEGLIPVTDRLKRDGSEEAPMKSNYDLGPRGILNELKAERLKRNRYQKIVYKRLVIQICQENRVVDLNEDNTDLLEVQP